MMMMISVMFINNYDCDNDNGVGDGNDDDDGDGNYDDDGDYIE